MSEFDQEIVRLPAASETMLPPQVLSVLSPAAIDSGLPRLLSVLVYSVQHIGENLRNAIYMHHEVGSTNSFGDSQLDADVKTDALIFQNLQSTGLIAVASSEENPIDIECFGEGFSVAFDPLDGSSIVDANFAVGSIIGIYPGRGFLGRTGREQVAAMVAQYGPRITIILGLNSDATADGKPVSMELCYSPEGWFVTVPRITIAPTCKTFAPGNLRATSDNPAYKSLVEYWIAQKYTLRYSGGLVPDVYHILVKQGGVLSNASSKSAKAKLRLLYECAPIALIIEAAGGGSCVCPSEVEDSIEPVSLLDVMITDLDRRVGVCYGSVEEIQRCKAFLFNK
jgi:sedoheptulose-bisphosphatase